MFVIMFASCSKKQEKEIYVEPPKEVVKSEPAPVNQVTNIDCTKEKRYNYYFANFDATSVDVKVDRNSYAEPATITYKSGKDTYKYILPKEYRVWKKPVIDKEKTVWICGWHKGAYQEYVFYGQKKFKGKITPNSFVGENGKITYR